MFPVQSIPVLSDTCFAFECFTSSLEEVQPAAAVLLQGWSSHQHRLVAKSEFLWHNLEIKCKEIHLSILPLIRKRQKIIGNTRKQRLTSINDVGEEEFEKKNWRPLQGGGEIKRHSKGGFTQRLYREIYDKKF